MTRAGVSAALAILTGASLAGFETLVNWGQWQWWPLWLVDYVAALALIGGGVLTLRRHSTGLRLLAAGWAFSIGTAWMSFAGNLAYGPDPARDGRVAGLYLALIALMLGTAATGLVLALTAREEKVR